MNSSKRIVVNTIAQYIRTVLSMVLSLLATRIILKSLGVEDYGIYSVVAGAVSLLSFLTNSLVITTQRFLSVSQGKDDINKSRNIFNNSIFLHTIITIVVLLLLEILFFFLFDGFLNIPDNKIFSAKILYQFVAIILCLTFLTSPFRAVVISHENIVYISIIDVIDAIFKLLIAYALFYISGDKLITYGGLLMLIQVFNLIALSIYSYIKYPECGKIYLRDFDSKYLRNMSSFAGWTMYNLMCNLGRTQGIAIGLNKFMGPVINASYGLSFQVSGALANVSRSLQNAINPQLMKAEGAGNRNRMFRLAEIESKFSYYLLAAVVIPCVFEMPRLLELWLGQIPPHSVLFCRMVILAALADSLTVGLGAAKQAEGNMKYYTLVLCTIKLLTLPIVILFLFLGVSMFWIAILYILFEFISSILRIPFLVKTAGLCASTFINRVFIKEIIPTIVLIITCVIIVYLSESTFRFLITFLVGIFSFSLAVLFTGLCGDELKIVKEYSRKFVKKLKR